MNHAKARPLLNTHSISSVSTTGAGAPMLFLPELNVSGEVWSSVVPHFAHCNACHVVDLAGFAGNAPVATTPFLDSVCDELAAYIRDHGLGRATVIGHGLGGFVAMKLASTSPGLVHRLIIIDSYPFYAGAGLNPHATADDGRAAAASMYEIYSAPLDPEFERKAEMAKKILVTRPEHVARVVLWRRASDRLITARALHELLSSDLREQLAEISARVLVVGTWIGKQQFSGTTRQEIELLFRRQFANARDWKLLLLDHARHFAMLDDPEGLARVIQDFLAEDGEPAASATNTAWNWQASAAHVTSAV